METIYPGAAVVLVDDQWWARLTADDYTGPLSLINKHLRFRAEANLYWMEGTLYINVQKVTEIF